MLKEAHEYEKYCINGVECIPETVQDVIKECIEYSKKHGLNGVSTYGVASDKPKVWVNK